MNIIQTIAGLTSLKSKEGAYYQCVETGLRTYLASPTGTVAGVDDFTDASGRVLKAQSISGGVSESTEAISLTTTELLVSTTVYPAGSVLNTSGYYTKGDGGAGTWLLTTTTLQTVSQNPAQLASAILNDGVGTQWRLLSTSGAERESYEAKALGVVGDGIVDDQPAIQAGLNSGNVVGNSLVCNLHSRLIISNSKGGLQGDITLSANSTYFNRVDNAYDNSDGTVLKITGEDVLVEGVTIKLNDNSGAENTTCGVQLRSAHNFKMLNCDLNNFSKTKVVRVEGCAGGFILHSKIHSCLINSATTGQLTAIDIDDNRPNGVASKGIEIAHNHIYDMVASASFLAAGYFYQTDGINVSIQNSNGHKIHHNRIERLGEAIDIFGNNCLVHDNHCEDLYMAGIKLIHGASFNHIFSNTIINPAEYGIGTFGSGQAATTNNLIYGNSIIDTNRDLDKDARLTAAPLKVDSQGATFVATHNVFRNNNIHNCNNADRVIIMRETGSTNYILNTRLTGTVPDSTKTTNETLGTITFADKAYVRANPLGINIHTTANSIPFTNVQEDSNGEVSGSIYTAKYPRVINIAFSARTPSAEIGKLWLLTIRKNNGILEEISAYVPVSGDFVISGTALGVKMLEGDYITVHLSNNETLPVAITDDGKWGLRINEQS